MDLGIAGKAAIVTGASHGLGRATTEMLAREGVRVAICGRHRETIEKAAKEVAEATGQEILPFVADIGVKADLENFVNTALDRFGTIDILVNNADADKPEGNFFEIPDEDWIEKMHTKLLAHVRMMRLCAPGMMEKKWGRIINVGGSSSRQADARVFTKGASQAGIITTTRKVSTALGHYGITVNYLEPGNMWSDGPTRGGKTRAELRGEEHRREADARGISYEEKEQEFLNSLTIGRRVTPEDAAGLIVMIASKQAATLTGEVVLADGGQSGYVRF